MRLDESERFANRSEAGRELGGQVLTYLKDLMITQRPLVLGMSRGGMPVAAQVADVIDGDLDVVVVTHISVPWRSEFPLGALAENGPVVIDHDALAGADMTMEDLAPIVRRQRGEIARQLDLFRGNHPAPEVSERVVIVVDDGMQTGVRACAALRSLHADMPAHLVFATPVAAAESFDRLAIEADGIVHVRCPCCSPAHGLWYRDCTEVTDAEVVAALRCNWLTTVR